MSTKNKSTATTKQKSRAEKATAKPETTKVTEDPGDRAGQHGDSIALAAYYKAEKRGFQPGYEMQDWFEAEQEMNA